MKTSKSDDVPPPPLTNTRRLSRKNVKRCVLIQKGYRWDWTGLLSGCSDTPIVVERFTFASFAQSVARPSRGVQTRVFIQHEMRWGLKIHGGQVGCCAGLNGWPHHSKSHRMNSAASLAAWYGGRSIWNSRQRKWRDRGPGTYRERERGQKQLRDEQTDHSDAHVKTTAACGQRSYGAAHTHTHTHRWDKVKHKQIHSTSRRREQM